MRHSRVYLAHCEAMGVFKIGQSSNVKKRLRSRELASPAPLILAAKGASGTGNAESALHTIFHEYRRHGEWFALPRYHSESLIRALSGAPLLTLVTPVTA